ncbi:MAG: BMP family ABC transporter substrate-binding protein [Clostridia bacterium]|nr:BMP family ABC transporter substrate-binding protein [Clostridia bacterium]
MRRVYCITIAVCLACIAVFGGIYGPYKSAREAEPLKVGFIYQNDETTPYTHNFTQAQQALEGAYGERVEVLVRSNVPEKQTAEPLEALLKAGCRIVFAYTNSAEVVEVAANWPDAEFCQVSYKDTDGVPYPNNYHTFNAESYQSRYVTGIAAGMKLRELIDAGELKADEALVGFVGANGNPETISAFTAFILGARTVAPEAVLKVRYTGATCSYSRERACAEALIGEGCRVIAQHTPTLGPAMACEEASQRQEKVYHIGQDQSLLDITPISSLVSARVNWTPYVLAAAEAARTHQDIDRVVNGNRHGSDVSAGFEKDWVRMLDVSQQNAAPGTREAIEKAVEAFKKGGAQVFKGSYTGVDPKNPSDTIDLSGGYDENARSSSPTFHYILDGVVEVES